MKDYVNKRIEGLTQGVSTLRHQIATLESTLAGKRNDLVATTAALQELQELSATLDKPEAAPAAEAPKS